MFVDQALVHFRRAGLPDIIHGHYADAGLAGARLASLLHVPFVFTGHSLGRVKRQRMGMGMGMGTGMGTGTGTGTGKQTAENLERKYKFVTRVEAEEIALETASMVVTSTSQEVSDQY